MGASEKRKDYISWDEYFMGIAMLSGMRSKDPNTQVGACIVDPEHKILSMGYNGFPLGQRGRGQQVFLFYTQRAQCYPKLQGRKP